MDGLVLEGKCVNPTSSPVLGLSVAAYLGYRVFDRPLDSLRTLPL